MAHHLIAHGSFVLRASTRPLGELIGSPSMTIACRYSIRLLSQKLALNFYSYQTFLNYVYIVLVVGIL